MTLTAAVVAVLALIGCDFKLFSPSGDGGVVPLNPDRSSLVFERWLDPLSSGEAIDGRLQVGWPAGGTDRPARLRVTREPFYDQRRPLSGLRLLGDIHDFALDPVSTRVFGQWNLVLPFEPAIGLATDSIGSLVAGRWDGLRWIRCGTTLDPTRGVIRIQTWRVTGAWAPVAPAAAIPTGLRRPPDVTASPAFLAIDPTGRFPDDLSLSVGIDDAADADRVITRGRIDLHLITPHFDGDLVVRAAHASSPADLGRSLPRSETGFLPWTITADPIVSRSVAGTAATLTVRFATAGAAAASLPRQLLVAAVVSEPDQPWAWETTAVVDLIASFTRIVPLGPIGRVSDGLPRFAWALHPPDGFRSLWLEIASQGWDLNRPFWTVELPGIPTTWTPTATEAERLARDAFYVWRIRAITASGTVVESPPVAFSLAASAVEPASPPRLLTSIPAAGATGVATSTRLQLVFDRPMDFAATRFAVTFEPPVAGEFEAAGALLRFAPRPGWSPATVYRVQIASSARSSDGLHLGEPLNFSFQTASDPAPVEPPAPLRVTMIVPASGSRDLPRGGPVFIGFDRAVATETFRRGLRVEPPPAAPASLTWTQPSRVAITFPAPLSASTTYLFTVGTETTDLSAAGLEQPITFRLTTGDDGGPLRLVSVSPASGGVSVAREGPFSFGFDRAVATATLLSALRIEPDPPTSSRIVWPAPDRVAIDFPALLAASTSYLFRLSTDLTDIAGIPLAGPVAIRFTTIGLLPPPATAALEVTAIVPADGSREVDPAGPFSVTFDRAIATPTFAAGFRILPPPPVAPLLTWTWPNHVVVSFASPLNASSTYSFQIGTETVGVDGSALPGVITVTFTTSGASGSANPEPPPPTPPRLVSSVPTDRARNVSINTAIELQFDRDMNPDSVEAGLTLAPPLTAPPSTGWSQGATRLTIVPRQPLAASTPYRLTIASTCTDLRGVALAEPVAITFTTSNLARPRVVSSSPADGELDVRRDRELIIRFDRPMDTGSVAAAWSIEPAQAPPPIASWTTDRTVLTLRPSTVGGWPNGARLVLRINTLARSLEGAAMAADFVLNFASADTEPPTILAVEPASGGIDVVRNPVFSVTFSEPVNAIASLIEVLPPPSGNAIASWSSDRRQYTIQWTAPLPPGVLHQVAVAATVTDDAGNALAGARTWSFLTGTAESARITATWPPPAATGVPRATPLRLEFDKEMASATVIAALLIEPALATAPTAGFDTTGRVLLITPRQPLANSTEYRVRLASGARDIDGIAYSQLWELRFITADEDPPRVVRVIPPPDSSGVDRRQPVSIVFSEPMVATTSVAAIIVTPAGPGGFRFAWSPNGTEITLQPSDRWPNAATLTVTVGTSATDLAGNPLVTATNWNFATADDQPPVLTAIDPPDLATGIARNPLVSLSFSEAVASAAVVEAVMLDPPPPAPGQWTVSPDGRIHRLDFGVAHLAAGTTYRIAVATTVTDLAGNALAAPFESRFTTAALIAPQVIRFEPPDLATQVDRDIDPAIVFSRPMDRGTTVAAVTVIPPWPIGTVADWADGDTRLSFLTPVPLANHTTYVVTVGTGTRSIDDVPLPAPAIAAFTTRDTEPPTVQTVNPPAEASEVSRAIAIEVVFSEPVARAGFEAGFAIEPMPAGGRGFAWSASDSRVLVTFTENLPGGTTFAVRVGSETEDLAGNRIPAAVTWRFTTATVVPPRVVTMSPFPNSTGNATSSVVRLTFDAAMQAASVLDAWQLSADEQPVPTSGTYTARVLTLSPQVGLPYDARVRIQVATTAVDVAGTPLATPFMGEFTTESAPQVIATATTPANGEVDRAPDTRVIVTFSKPMDRSSAESAFTLAGSATTVIGSFTWSGTTMTFTPKSILAENNTYTFAVSQAARDQQGNPLAAIFGATFRTVSQPGRMWTEELADDDSPPATQFSERYGHRLLTFANQFFVIGGTAENALNDVWRSPDGRTWTRILNDRTSPPATQFSQRYDHAALVHDAGAGARMWVIGGESLDDDTGDVTVYNDVWRSADGISWQRMVASAAFAPRSGHQVLSFGGRMWLLGGATLVAGSPVVQDDIWSSADGVTWRPEPVIVGFFARRHHGATVLNGRMYVVAGNGRDALGIERKLADAWSSANGLVWVREVEDGGFGRRSGPGLIVHRNRLWLIGGETTDPGGFDVFANDIWTSDNGRAWQRLLGDDEGLPGQFSPRGFFGLTESGGKLWLTGGFSDFGPVNDVWSCP